MKTFISFLITRSCVTTLLFALLSSYNVFAGTTDTIKPPDVFRHVARVHEELNLLQFHMGKPTTIEQPRPMRITNAAPREVYFQALTLYEKSNQFGFDYLRTRTMPISTPGHAIKPADVFDVISAALERVHAVKSHLNISTTIKEPELDPTKTPTDVLVSIIKANREINNLLDHQFAPKDVYKKVTLAIGYSAQILAQFPNVERIPSAEPIQRGIKPSAVFERLVGCYKHIRVIAERSNIHMLTLDVKLDALNIAPSDVYDIASLVVSELAFIHSTLGNMKQPRAIYDPGRKFPSHVYQRVSILEEQIKLLDTATISSANWLSTRLAKATN